MKPLGTNLEYARTDFESVTGKPFRDFFCPILHVDEGVPLTKGHVVPRSLGGKTMVLQREDIDQGFGSFFEAEAADAIRHGLDENPLDVVARGDADQTKQLARRFGFHLMFEGTDKVLDARYGKQEEGAAFFVETEAVKAALGEADGQRTLMGVIGVGLDARSSILVTSLRASHLAWFRLCGYRYVFSNEGLFVAWVLRSIYEKFIAPRRRPNRTKKGSLMSDEVKSEVDAYCLQFANFIRPLPGPVVETLPAAMQTGTPDTGWFFALWDGDDLYGRISVVKLGDQRVAVMTPVITDARGWALFDVVANLDLVFSEGRFDADTGVCRVDPPGRHTIWPSLERAGSVPTMSIREAAQLVIESGRML